MTSNIGAELISNNKAALGFSGEKDDIARREHLKRSVNDEVKKYFKPEFINRVDEIIIFERLTKEEIKEIASRMLNELKERCKNNGINVTFDMSAIEYVSEKGFDDIYGARPLRREITSQSEDQLATMKLSGEIPLNKTVKCYCENETIKFKTDD
jgi:ATP-dependent Clp protease ATP-binding subunit ClpC